MSLKGKILGIAGAEIAKKINAKGFVDNVVNNLSEKAAKSSGIKTLNEYKKKEDKNYMVFKIPSATIGTMINVFRDPYKAIEKFGSMYQFCDMDGNVKYTSDFDTGLISDRETVTLYDEKKNKYGKVKEYLISVGIPLFEKEVKKCSVDFEKSNLCKLKKYVSFGELGFETLEGKMYIECSDEKKKKYKIKKGNKIIAKVNELPPKFIDGLAEHYIMEYENVEEEKLITLMVVALNILMSN